MGLIRDQVIDPKGKTAEQLYVELYRYFKKHRGQFDVQTTVDYTGDLLEHGRSAFRRKQPLMACMFFGTWIEHFLNRLVHTLAGQRKVSPRHCGLLIRDTNLRAKFVWVHAMLGITAPENQLQRLQTLSDKRNYFVHYKWQPEAETLEKEIQSALKQGRALISYLQRLEEKYISKSSSADISRLTRAIERVWIERNLYEGFQKTHAPISPKEK